MTNDNELQCSTPEGTQPTIGDVPVGLSQAAHDTTSDADTAAAEAHTSKTEEPQASETVNDAPADAVETTELPAAAAPTLPDPHVETPAPPRKDNGCLIAVLGALWWLIKFTFRKWRFTLTLLLLGALAYVGYRVKKVYIDGDGLFSTPTQAIDTTPEEIRSLRDIGQWEMLSVDTEELVEKNEHSLLSTAQMVCVYRGTLRIGIDMAKTTEKWCDVQGKSVTLHLPEVELLDNDFINDTRTTVFVQEGNWSAEAKQQMRTQAAEAMKKRALSAENLSLARRNAEEQFRKLFAALGYEEVNIVFGDGKNN